MKFLDIFATRSCGCKVQKAMFRDSLGITNTTWVVTERCDKHKEEQEALVNFFNEGAPITESDEDD